MPPTLEDAMRARIAYGLIMDTCGWDAHTLWKAETVLAKFDAAGVPDEFRPHVWTLDARDVASLRERGGWGTVGASLVSGDSIVSVLARWANVDTSPSMQYMGRGTSHRAAVACFRDASIAAPCDGPETCPMRLGDTCPHHPEFVEG